jgi:hypothetical protein
LDPKGDYAVSKPKITLFVIPLLIGGQLVSVGNARQQPQQTKAVHLTGLTGVKNNTKGSLKVENQNLRFTHSSSTTDLTPRSMERSK